MTDIVELLPCPFCAGPVHRRTEHGVEGCFHIAGPHCPVLSHRLMTVEQWNTRAAYEVMARGDGEAALIVERLRRRATRNGTNPDPDGLLMRAAEIIESRLGSSGHEG